MDIVTSFSQLNWLAIVLATVIGFFVLGGVWYGPLFGRAWMDACGYSEDELAERNMLTVFTLSFILALVAAINLAMFIGAGSTAIVGLMAGFFAGTGWVAMFLGILYLFEQRPLKLFLINAGYSILALSIMGTILGAM